MAYNYKFLGIYIKYIVLHLITAVTVKVQMFGLIYLSERFFCFI